MNPPPTPAWARRLLGDRAVSCGPVAGGTSRDTILLEVPPEQRRVVARHDGGAGPLSGTPFTLAREAAAFAAAARAGVLVPDVVAIAPDGRSFAVGEVPGRAASGAEALDDYLRVLGDLHATGTAHAPVGHPGFDRAGAEHLVLWEAIVADRVRRPAPIAVAAFTALRSHGAERPAEVALCHGDAGAGNYLHRDGRVTGLVDWEMAHTGDPHGDLASIAVRAALSSVDLGDYRSRLASHWEPASGLRFDPHRYRLAVVGVLARMVVSCLATLDHPDPSTDRSVQLMGLPLMEVHLLRALAALDGPQPAPPGDVEPDPAYAREVAALVADALGPPAGARGAAAALARRHRYLADQLVAVLGACERSAAPTGPGDTFDEMWLAAHARLAVLPASRRLADAVIAGVVPAESGAAC